MATSLNPPYPPHILPRVLVCLATVLSVAFFVFGWHRFVPLLGTWEYFHFFYAFGSIDPEVTFAIAPRANIGGQGYPLIDIGIRLTETIGLSLPSFRAISFIHALLTYVALITVFSRWFGLIPAAAGVTLTVLSTGYVFFANQVLVSFPTLLLCVLLISATQRLERSPGSTAVLLLISAICALLLVHYSMGRFFAVGWLIYLFATHILAAVTMFSRKDLVRRYVIRQAGLALTVMTATTFILLLLYAGNVRALMNPATIFFPSFGAEIEIKPSEILSTILQNTALIGEMLFPFVSFSGDGLATNFLDGHRAPLLDYWHAPLLALGVLVALRRSLRKDGPTSWPYLALHATAALTFGLALFSAHYDDIWTISPYRIFGGYIAIAGYMTVAFLWVHEAARTRVAPFKHAAVILAVVAVAASAASLTKQSDAILKSTEALAPINVVSGDFAPYPEVYSYGDYVIPRLQARYRTLARNLAPYLKCPTGSSAIILLRLDPAMLLDKGTYPGLHYLRELNDLSPLMRLYLSDAGVHSGVIIVHKSGARGYVDRGHGYGGKPRVFSGPITWRNGKISYNATDSVMFDLKEDDRRSGPLVIVAFSDAEAKGAESLAAERGVTLTKIGPITHPTRIPTSLKLHGSCCGNR